MKKLLLSLIAISVIGLFAPNAAFAAFGCKEGCPVKTEPACEKPCERHCPTTNECEIHKGSRCSTTCGCECLDKYWANKECYLDKEYMGLKQEMCLTSEQECAIDGYYRTLKQCLKPQKTKLFTQREKLCQMIADEDCKSDINAQKKDIKDTKKEIKSCFKCFKKDVRSELCTLGEKHTFNKYMRKENRKIKALYKACPVCKLPCCKQY